MWTCWLGSRHCDAMGGIPSESDDFLAGLHMASPEVQERIIGHARWKKVRTPPPIVVPPSDFIGGDEVKGLLRRTIATAWLLRDAYRASDGVSGFTRESVERELRWQERATMWARFRRTVRIVLGPVIGWWDYPPGT
jgi:hypothetical protein